MAMTAKMKHSYLSDSDLIAHVRILEVEASATEAIVEVVVLQLVSAKSRLVANSNIRFRLELVTRGEEPDGDCYMYRSDLEENALLEVYLSESPGSRVAYRARYVHPLDCLPDGAQYLAAWKRWSLQRQHHGLAGVFGPGCWDGFADFLACVTHLIHPWRILTRWFSRKSHVNLPETDILPGLVGGYSPV